MDVTHLKWRVTTLNVTVIEKNASGACYIHRERMTRLNRNQVMAFFHNLSTQPVILCTKQIRGHTRVSELVQRLTVDSKLYTDKRGRVREVVLQVINIREVQERYLLPGIDRV